MRRIAQSPLNIAVPLVWMVMSACSGSVEPGPDGAEPSSTTEAPRPRRPEAPKSGLSGIDKARAPLSAPVPATIDLEDADPMAIVEARGPGGQPATAMSLVVASRGDGEIEPCG